MQLQCAESSQNKECRLDHLLFVLIYLVESPPRSIANQLRSEATAFNNRPNSASLYTPYFHIRPFLSDL